ncbi:MAG: hypothetical protein KID00_13910 [Clostridium argentinense]|uniref:hypothetical protein n=1 Tax=Clostridium butanoliproducens TaxID=2991837 RepID=UPI001DF93E82|nr:hypothetical protein [Clostridium butanoliproducens]MBS5824920.1 hypothetical protein [Clostridium argentinense]MDU1349375.1 hypothetical protein [Clostridium argentinense]
MEYGQADFLNCLRLVKLSKENKDDLTNFDCVNENDKGIIGFKSKKRKKFLAHSKNMNEFLINEALDDQKVTF